MFTDKLLTEVLEMLDEMALEYSPTHDYRLPVHDGHWMELARAKLRARLMGAPQG
jgi:hypothetical protein